jgi:hypothetical protein
VANDTNIVNSALTLLGEQRILSMDDNVKPAREAKALFEQTRDGLLAGYNWSFAMARANLPALLDAPEFGYSLKYQMPADCLRLIQIGEFYAGLNLSDYRGMPTEEFMIEGRQILTDMSAPLPVRYVFRETNPANFGAAFVDAFSAKLAEKLAESLTQSDSKRGRAEAEFHRAIGVAIRANAIELPPKKLPDDEWLVSRL